MVLQPAIERRLRFFEQAHTLGESGFLRGIQSEPLRGGVERGGNRDGDFLVVERATRLGEAAVPGAGSGRTTKSAPADGGNLLRRRKILRSPGQDRRRPVGGMVT